MNYDESLSYLLSLGNEVSAMKLGLENIGKLLDALGNPQKKYLKIQVAGTNGKGSTCAFLDAICLSANIKTGLYTSPHLVSITERIKIGGREISEENFAFYATKIRQTSEDLVESFKLESVPTFFEQLTAIALLAFADEKIELAILETGLGGRFDATTAADAEIAAITQIDYDHQQYLGETLTEIAAEKAAIIRAETKAVIVARQKAEAQKVISERCRTLGKIPVSKCNSIEENSQEIFYKTENGFYAGELSLEGEHQRENACVAIDLAETLAADFGFPIGTKEIEEGLRNAEHKGRLEWRKVGETDILFDGAHNAAGARALRNYLEKYCGGREIHFVFGAMRDKNLAEIGEILFPLAYNLILTEPQNSRAENVETLLNYAGKSVEKTKIFQIPKVEQAIDSAIQLSESSLIRKKSFVCVTGSLYLVGEAQKYLFSVVHRK